MTICVEFIVRYDTFGVSSMYLNSQFAKGHTDGILFTVTIRDGFEEKVFIS